MTEREISESTRTRLIEDYCEKSSELARNLFVTAMALEGLKHMHKCEGSQLSNEYMMDFIYGCWTHITDAAEHLRKDPTEYREGCQGNGGES